MIMMMMIMMMIINSHNHMLVSITQEALYCHISSTKFILIYGFILINEQLNSDRLD